MVVEAVAMGDAVEVPIALRTLPRNQIGNPFSTSSRDVTGDVVCSRIAWEASGDERSATRYVQCFAQGERTDSSIWLLVVLESEASTNGENGVATFSFAVTNARPSRRRKERERPHRSIRRVPVHLEVGTYPSCRLAVGVITSNFSKFLDHRESTDIGRSYAFPMLSFSRLTLPLSPLFG